MSAFLVEDRTINRVVTWLVHQRANSYYRELIAPALGCECDDPDFAQKLGISMVMLNTDAVNGRYGQARPPDITYRFRNEPAAKMQVLKSLRCWLYQCAEHDIPKESALYQVMEQASLHLAFEIVRELPAWEALAWE